MTQLIDKMRERLRALEIKVCGKWADDFLPLEQRADDILYAAGWAPGEMTDEQAAVYDPLTPADRAWLECVLNGYVMPSSYA